MDIAVLVPFDKFALLKVWVQLHLMHLRWMRLAVLQEILHLMGAEVGHADMVGLAFVNQIFHCFPRVPVIDEIHAEYRLGDRPVHEVEIEIV